MRSGSGSDGVWCGCMDVGRVGFGFGFGGSGSGRVSGGERRYVDLRCAHVRLAGAPYRVIEVVEVVEVVEVSESDGLDEYAISGGGGIKNRWGVVGMVEGTTRCFNV